MYYVYHEMDDKRPVAAFRSERDAFEWVIAREGYELGIPHIPRWHVNSIYLCRCGHVHLEGDCADCGCAFFGLSVYAGETTCRCEICGVDMTNLMKADHGKLHAVWWGSAQIYGRCLGWPTPEDPDANR